MGIFDKQISKLISTAYRLREKADYQDFYIVSEDEAKGQIAKAETVIKLITVYLNDRTE